MNNKGFTLIELIIVIVVIALIGSIGYGFFTSNVHYDWSTGTRTKCVNGYVYVQAKSGGALTQQIGADGKPDRCN